MNCYNKIEKEVLECVHKKDTCTRNIRNITNATMDKMNIGVHLDTRDLKQSIVTHMPKNVDHGYYSIDGKYHKL